MPCSDFFFFKYIAVDGHFELDSLEFQATSHTNNVKLFSGQAQTVKRFMGFHQDTFPTVLL